MTHLDDEDMLSHFAANFPQPFGIPLGRVTLLGTFTQSGTGQQTPYFSSSGLALGTGKVVASSQWGSQQD